MLSPPSQRQFRIHNGIFGDLAEFAVTIAFASLHGVVGASDVKEAVVVPRNGDSGVYNAGVLEVVEGVGGVVELCAVA